MPDVSVSQRGEKQALNVDKNVISNCCTYHKSWKATLYLRAQGERKQHQGSLQSFWARVSKSLQVRAKMCPEDTTTDRKEKEHRDEIKAIPKSFSISLQKALTCMFQGLCWPHITEPTECTFRETYRLPKLIPCQGKGLVWVHNWNCFLQHYHFVLCMFSRQSLKYICSISNYKSQDLSGWSSHLQRSWEWLETYSGGIIGICPLTLQFYFFFWLLVQGCKACPWL